MLLYFHGGGFIMGSIEDHDPLCGKLAEDLSDMPPSVIVTAEFDPLRDDGEEFSRRLEAAGSEVHLIRMDGMMHGFAIYWQRFSRAAKLLEDIGRIVKTRSRGLQR